MQQYSDRYVAWVCFCWNTIGWLLASGVTFALSTWIIQLILYDADAHFSNSILIRIAFVASYLGWLYTIIVNPIYTTDEVRDKLEGKD